MTQEKKERILLASVVVSIVLLFIMIMVLIFQGVSINAKKKERLALQRERARLEQLEKETNDKILIWEQEQTIIEWARRVGYKFPEEVEKE